MDIMEKHKRLIKMLLQKYQPALKKDEGVQNVTKQMPVPIKNVSVKQISSKIKREQHTNIKMFAALKRTGTAVDNLQQASLMTFKNTDNPGKSPDVKHQVRGLKNFEIGRRLGTGAFGFVFLAREKKYRHLFALKVLLKSQIIEYDVKQQVRREIENQKSLRHPNIIRLYGHFHDEKRIYLILEFAAHGTLYNALQSQPNKRFDEQKSAHYIRSLASALLYLHKRNIIHRDMKLENILLGDNDVLKIADFGCSVLESLNSKRTTLCGTLCYLAPEIAVGLPYTKNVDIWSLGVLCYELLVGRAPFLANDNCTLSKKIIKGTYELPDHVSKAAAHLISKLLVLIPDKRLPLNEVLVHPWIAAHTTQCSLKDF